MVNMRRIGVVCLLLLARSAIAAPPPPAQVTAPVTGQQRDLGSDDESAVVGRAGTRAALRRVRRHGVAARAGFDRPDCDVLSAHGGAVVRYDLPLARRREEPVRHDDGAGLVVHHGRCARAARSAGRSVAGRRRDVGCASVDSAFLDGSRRCRQLRRGVRVVVSTSGRRATADEHAVQPGRTGGQHDLLLADHRPQQCRRDRKPRLEIHDSCRILRRFDDAGPPEGPHLEHSARVRREQC